MKKEKLRRIFITSIATLLLMSSFTACKKAKSAGEEIVIPPEIITEHQNASVTQGLSDNKTLAEILGTAGVTSEPTATLSPTATSEVAPIEVTPTPTKSIEQPSLSDTELADTLFNLLNKQEELPEEVTDSEKVADDAMTIFANNIKGGNYVNITTTKHTLENIHECTVVSQTPGGSIVQFKSDSTTNVNSIIVVYITDLTAWTVIGENNVIYALMPTPEDTSTEYEKQIVSTIIDQHSNGKDLDVRLVYPSVNAFDGKNNCAAYLITTDGTFNIGSNAKTYAFYKYDYIK